MNVVFTICSNNYLAQAKTMLDSVLEFNTSHYTVIVLCDIKNNEIDYSFFEPHLIVEASELNISEFARIQSKYNIIELNTSLKPFAFQYLYKKYQEAQIVLYLDPDIEVLSPLSQIECKLIESSILLTPHILFPIDFDGLEPTENLFAQYGMYNLGFLGTKRGPDTEDLLYWWSERMLHNCYDKPSIGVFVDQLPMNYAPIFFNNVTVSKNEGVNVAPWNLHERNITKENGKYYVNGKDPLIFYHFSSLRTHNHLTLPTSAYSRGRIFADSATYQLYDNYMQKIYANGYETFSEIPCAYGKTKSNHSKLLHSVLQCIKKFLRYH